jgi:hypothetical protein
MSRDTKGAGLWNASSYQVSGVPFVTSSLAVPSSSAEPLQISFPYVTKNFIVRNDSAAAIRIGFSANGVKGIPNNNYITLDAGISFEADYKVTSIFLLAHEVGSASGSISAGLTGIQSNQLTMNWSGSTFSAGIG